MRAVADYFAVRAEHGVAQPDRIDIWFITHVHARHLTLRLDAENNLQTAVTPVLAADVKKAADEATRRTMPREKKAIASNGLGKTDAHPRISRNDGSSYPSNSLVSRVRKIVHHRFSLRE